MLTFAGHAHVLCSLMDRAFPEKRKTYLLDIRLANAGLSVLQTLHMMRENIKSHREPPAVGSGP